MNLLIFMAFALALARRWLDDLPTRGS